MLKTNIETHGRKEYIVRCTHGRTSLYKTLLRCDIAHACRPVLGSEISSAVQNKWTLSKMNPSAMPAVVNFARFVLHIDVAFNGNHTTINRSTVTATMSHADKCKLKYVKNVNILQLALDICNISNPENNLIHVFNALINNTTVSATARAAR